MILSSFRFGLAPSFSIETLQVLLREIYRINALTCLTLLQGKLFGNDFTFSGIKIEVILCCLCFIPEVGGRGAGGNNKYKEQENRVGT